jgi:DNA-binding transcriptional ArsR family regulator
MFDDPRTSVVKRPAGPAVGVASPRSMSAEPISAGSIEPCGPAHPCAEEISLTDVLAALSDPVRLSIVACLAAGPPEMSCKSIQIPVAKSTGTHHFRVLREAGVIRQRIAGTTRMTSLRREELDARFPGLLDAVLRGLALPR